MEERVFRSRIAEVRRALMQPARLDLVVAYADDVLAPGAVRYLADFDVYAMYALVLVPREGDVVLAFGLHHSAYLVRVRQTAIADYFVGTYKPGPVCAQLLSECGASDSARVGVVGGAGMFSSIDADIRANLPKASFVNVDADFWSLILSASQEFVAAMRRSARIAVRSLEEAHHCFQCGETRRSTIAARVTSAARRLGADIQNREMVGVRIAAGNPLPPQLSPTTQGSPVTGDALAIEASPSYAGARTLYARTFAEAKCAGQLAAAERVHASICDLIRPGVSTGVLLRDANAIAVAAEMRLVNSEVVCGIGLNARQPGLHLPEVRTGMFLTVRTNLETESLGTIHRADTILVTEHGFEALTTLIGT